MEALSTAIALIALGFSAFNLWDSRFRTNVQISLGRQMRFYVAVSELAPGEMQPAIFATVNFYNGGGRFAFVREFRLRVKLSGDGKTLTREFTPIREISNFILAEGGSDQMPVSPIAVAGRTSLIRQYVFCPSEKVAQAEIPTKFDIAVDIEGKQVKKWRHHSTVAVKSVPEVWQDLNMGKYNMQLVYADQTA